MLPSHRKKSCSVVFFFCSLSIIPKTQTLKSGDILESKVTICSLTPSAHVKENSTSHPDQSEACKWNYLLEFFCAGGKTNFGCSIGKSFGLQGLLSAHQIFKWVGIAGGGVVWREAAKILATLGRGGGGIITNEMLLRWGVLCFSRQMLR